MNSWMTEAQFLAGLGIAQVHLLDFELHCVVVCLFLDDFVNDSSLVGDMSLTRLELMIFRYLVSALRRCVF